MAVMILQEQGKLEAHDAVSKCLSQTPKHWEGVTIHHLLTHTSGIPSYTGMPSYPEEMMLPQSVEQMIDRFRDEPLEFEPGEKFQYSNSGYFLLGVIIENASGMSYEDYLGEALFEPLGLNETGYAVALLLKQGGHELKAERLEVEVPEVKTER